MLNIYEIYPSIEGETTQAGWPSVFVRLAGCNLKCSWCDTPYAREGGEPMELDRIVDEVKEFGLRRVVVTGGEPLHQDDCKRLINYLAEARFQVFLETNGSLDIGQIDNRATIRLDLKPPSSGMSDSVRWDNISKLKPTDEIKIVIADAGDYSWAVDRIRELYLLEKCTVNLTPELESMQSHILARWIIDDKLDARLNLQIHKIIWGPGARGV